MAKKTDLLLADTDTVIGAGVRIKGTLVSDGDITIDGRLTGEIKTNGNLSLGVNAQVKADVTGVNLKIAGQLVGNIKSSGETHITESGKVIGDITTSSLQIEAGAIFVGQSSMTETEVSEPNEVEEPTQR